MRARGEHACGVSRRSTPLIDSGSSSVPSFLGSFFKPQSDRGGSIRVRPGERLAPHSRPRFGIPTPSRHAALAATVRHLEEPIEALKERIRQAEERST